MNAATVRSVSPEQRFARERFSRLLHRRLQVEVALRQMPAGRSQTWLVRALDGVIADELRQLERLALAAEAHEELETFREALSWIQAGGDRAA